MTYKVAFSRMALDGKLGKGDPRWKELAGSYVNHDLEVVDIANYIYLGHSYTCWLKEPWRCKENFELAQVLTVDLDTEDERSNPDDLESHPFVRAYGGMIYATPSHKPEAPRCRVLFFLDEPITSAEGYKSAALTVLSQFPGADPGSANVAMPFNGSKDCDLRLIMRELPVAHLRTMFHRYGKSIMAQMKGEREQAENVIRLSDYQRTYAPDKTGDKANMLVDWLYTNMTGVPEGSRNHALNRLAFLAGKMVAKGEVQPEEAERALLAAAHRAGLEPKEAMQTFNSGFNAGQKAVG